MIPSSTAASIETPCSHLLFSLCVVCAASYDEITYRKTYDLYIVKWSSQEVGLMDRLHCRRLVKDTYHRVCVRDFSVLPWVDWGARSISIQYSLRRDAAAVPIQHRPDNFSFDLSIIIWWYTAIYDVDYYCYYFVSFFFLSFPKTFCSIARCELRRSAE